MNRQMEIKDLRKNISEEDNTVIKSDDYVRESGVQGGKIFGEDIVLGSLIFGIPFLIIGLYVLCCMVFGLGYPKNTAMILGALLITVMGLLCIIGGYSIYRTKHEIN